MRAVGDDVRGSRWAGRDLFALDADVTVYWPDASRSAKRYRKDDEIFPRLRKAAK